MIGIFDSGIGGLSVFREIRRLLPYEDYVYFSDSAHCPYGGKTRGYIIERCRNIVGKGMVNQVALLQVATADACFLFRLNHIGLPDFLEEFLQNDVLKVGLSLKDDFRMLSRRNRQDPRTGNWVELQDYVPHFGIEEMSLQKIYALLFGEKISKTQRLSNWEAETLTEAQQLYAATDAWACVRIYEYLEELRRTGDYRIEKQ